MSNGCGNCYTCQKCIKCQGTCETCQVNYGGSQRVETQNTWQDHLIRIAEELRNLAANIPNTTLTSAEDDVKTAKKIDKKKELILE